MKRIYMTLSITRYSYAPASCYFYERVDGQPSTTRKLTLEEANRLQWELVKAGAKRVAEANPFRNSVSHVDVTYFARH